MVRIVTGHLSTAERFEAAVAELCPARFASTTRRVPWIWSRMVLSSICFANKSIRFTAIIIIPSITAPVIALDHAVLSISSIIWLAVTPAKENFDGFIIMSRDALCIVNWRQVCPVERAIQAMISQADPIRFFSSQTRLLDLLLLCLRVNRKKLSAAVSRVCAALVLWHNKLAGLLSLSILISGKLDENV
jgi:hypothetical protein